MRRAGPLLACVLAVGLWGAGSAHAATRGFHVWNVTSRPLRIERVQIAACERPRLVEPPCAGYGFDSSPTAPPMPNEGDEILPGVTRGDRNHIEINVAGYPHGAMRLIYSGDRVPSSENNFVVTLNTYEATLRGSIDCTPQPRADRPDRTYCFVVGTWVWLYDPPGTVRNYTASDPFAQEEQLRNLCNSRNMSVPYTTPPENRLRVTCAFTPKERQSVLSSNRLLDSPFANCGGATGRVPVSTDYDFQLTPSHWTYFRDDWEVSPILSQAVTAIGSKYGTRPVEDYRRSFDGVLSIPPKHRAWLEASTQLLRDTGDFRIVIGNTTVNVTGVGFDSADPTDRTLRVVQHDAPMTPEQINEVCTAQTGIVRAPDDFATIAQTGTGGPDALRGGPGRDVMSGSGGNDILNGGASDDRLFGGRGNDHIAGDSGDDRLFGGPGNDVIFGGPGRDVIYGGAGSDRIVDTHGPTVVYTGAGGRSGRDYVDVRDLKGDDTVICGNRRAVVRADSGDRLVHCRR